MHLKDYYSILAIEPSATLSETKKAYRKLAHQYHPDKNQNDPYASAQFAEIKEAYEVLTNPSKKEYYLQQRWYNQSIGKRKSQDVINPVTLLLQSLELEKYVSKLDEFRMDKAGLQQYILELVSDPVVDQLKKFTEPETIREIVNVILRAMHPLPKLYTKDITTRLYKIAADDDIAKQQIFFFIQTINKKHSREKITLLFIIVSTLILCLLIYLAGR